MFFSFKNFFPFTHLYINVLFIICLYISPCVIYIYICMCMQSRSKVWSTFTHRSNMGYLVPQTWHVQKGAESRATRESFQVLSVREELLYVYSISLASPHWTRQHLFRHMRWYATHMISKFPHTWGQSIFSSLTDSRDYNTHCTFCIFMYFMNLQEIFFLVFDHLFLLVIHFLIWNKEFRFNFHLNLNFDLPFCRLITTKKKTWHQLYFDIQKK